MPDGYTKKRPDRGQPEWRWVESLLMQARGQGLKVYFKPNLTVRPTEYPEEYWNEATCRRIEAPKDLEELREWTEGPIIDVEARSEENA